MGIRRKPSFTIILIASYIGVVGAIDTTGLFAMLIISPSVLFGR
jgi:hypothetical protein